MILEASAKRMLLALSVPAVTVRGYSASTRSAASGVEPEVTLYRRDSVLLITRIDAFRAIPHIEIFVVRER